MDVVIKIDAEVVQVCGEVAVVLLGRCTGDLYSEKGEAQVPTRMFHWVFGVKTATIVGAICRRHVANYLTRERLRECQS